MNNKLYTIKILSIIFISLNLLKIINNQIGIILFITIIAYDVTSLFINECVKNNDSLLKCFIKNCLSYLSIYYISISLIILSYTFFSALNYSYNEQYIINYTTMTTQFKYIVPLYFTSAIAFYLILNAIIFYIFKKYIKSLTKQAVLYIALAFVFIISSNIFSNIQILSLAIMSIASVVAVIKHKLKENVIPINNIFINNIVNIVLIALCILIFKNNIFILAVVSLVIILINKDNNELLNNKSLERISRKYVVYVFSIITITNIVLETPNISFQGLVITLNIIIASILLANVLYYLIYFPLANYKKIRRIIITILPIVLLLSIYFFTTSNITKNDYTKNDIIDQSMYKTTDVSMLISNVHGKYLLSKNQENIASKNIVYYADETGVSLKEEIQKIKKNTVVLADKNNSFATLSQLTDEYNDAKNIIIVDVSKDDKNTYSYLQNFIKLNNKTKIYLVTNINDEETKVFFERSEVEFENVNIIDFAYYSQNQDKYYYSNSNNLTKLGNDAYINYVISQISNAK